MGARVADPRDVDRLLLAHYGKYPAPGKPRLLDELLYFMLSTRTTTRSCEQAFRAFKRRFPRHDAILDAPVETLATPLKCVGFSQRRATDIRASWRMLKEHFGRVTLAPLAKMPAREAEDFLMALPGVGTKIARCFLMFGLRMSVFAVDTHIWRISQRLGWIADQGGRAPRQPGVDAIQAFIPMGDAVSLHVNMIFLGRDFCAAHETRCGTCPLRTVCPFKR
ncbi:MAG: hypothetical protein FWG50_13150 [Kiritimatiellaeota bacterium]|nr:hypothetical protein [Kiritimatiellota bacterium]